MKRIFFIGLIIVNSLIVSACGIFSGEDNSAPPTELEEFEQKVQVDTVWSKDVGVGVDEVMVNLKPAIIDDIIYTIDREGQMTSLNMETGAINWEIELDNTITGGVGANNSILVVGNNRGEIIAINNTDGSQKWRKELSSVMLATPLIHENILVVRTGDGKVYGLNTEDGSQLWVYDRGVPVLTLRGNSSPIIGGNELIFTGFDSGKVAAVGIKHGRLLWEANAAVPRGRSDLERLVDIDGNIILIGRVLYVVSYQGRIVAIDALKGEILWAKEMSSYAGMGSDERHLYVTDADSNLWAVDRVTGDMLWKQDKLAYRSLTAPTAINDFVIVGDFEGYLHVMSRLTGEIIGREKIDGDGLYVQPLVEGQTVYIYSNGGKLSALRLN